MSTRHSALSRIPIIQFLFWSFVIALALFGGASRASVLAQPVIRLLATLALAMAIFFGPRFDTRFRSVGWWLALVVLLLVLQLLPLPPELWQMLPGRSDLLQADQLAGQNAVWRPLSLEPDATLNALFALLPPTTMWVLAAVRPSTGSRPLLLGILVMAGVGSVAGFFQFAGGAFTNPFINADLGIASGFMANRNHQAVLLATAIAVVPAVLVVPGRRALIGAGVAASIGIWFTLLILATGSRAGMALAILAWVGALVTAAPAVVPALRRLPRKVAGAAVGGVAIAVGGAVTASVWASRATSVDRLSAVNLSEDMRSRGLPVVWQSLRQYFPFGTGAGTFDSVFRLHEPFALLKPTYFNHAHNDWLEVPLTMGLPGVVLLGMALIWWCKHSWQVWRNRGTDDATGRAGSLVILILMLASVVDYPLRTPTMMSILVLSACAMLFVERRSQVLGDSALPAASRVL